MLRFSPYRPGVPQAARWPAIDRPEPRTPFSRRPDLELLSVVIDAELLDLEQTEPTPDLLLAGLLSHEFVQLRRYRDEGPPAAAPQTTNPLSTAAVDGWLVVTGAESGPPPWGVVSAGEGSVLEASVLHDFLHAAAQDSDHPAYADRGTVEGAQQRRRDAIAAQAAAAIDADLFVTTRPYLQTASWNVGSGVLIATPEQALPLVSLYLRAQDQFVGWRDSDGRMTLALTRGAFYSRAAVELVLRGWTVLKAATEHAESGGEGRLADLAQAVFGRLQQALRARDRMYWALNRPQDRDTADDALSAFDQALLTLMGAVDSSARLAHRLLGLDASSEQAIGWHQKGWRSRVREASATFDEVFSDGRHQHALVILGELRNTIHTAPLDPLALLTPRSGVATVIELPSGSATQLLSAMNNLGGATAWGVERHASGVNHADPAQLLDTLVVAITSMLDALMSAMPVDGLAGVDPSSAQLPEAVLFTRTDVPAESVLWQLGFPSPV